jgi:AraC-like DNA-binding protein
MFELQPVKNEIEITGFNNIYYFEFGKNFTHEAEKHNFWEMVYIDSGKVLAITDNGSQILNQGQMIFHEPGELHSHISDSKTPNNMLVISFSCNSPNMSFFKRKIFSADKTAKALLKLFTDEAKNALGTISNDYKDKRNLDFSNSKFASTQLLVCYMTELLISIIRNESGFEGRVLLKEKASFDVQNSICQLVVDYMKENIYSSLSLSDICSHFMIGKSNLCNIFSANMNTSIINYYNSLKMFEAKNLIRSNQYSINQISEMLGYSCIHSFSRSFKNAVGCSPTAYKKRIL